MTRDIIWLEPDDSIEAAYDLMAKLSIRHIPVVEGSRIVGMLSDRDVLTWGNVKHGVLTLPKMPIAEVMARMLITCPPSATVAELAALMLQHKIDSIPIVDEGNELLGLVTSSDLLTLLAEGERIEEVTKPYRVSAGELLGDD